MAELYVEQVMGIVSKACESEQIPELVRANRYQRVCFGIGWAMSNSRVMGAI